MTKRWNVCSPVSYTDRDGDEKTKWMTHGVMFENRNKTGFNIILDSLPTARDDGQMKLMCFLPSDDAGSPSKRTRAEHRPKTQNDFDVPGRGDIDDEIPF